MATVPGASGEDVLQHARRVAHRHAVDLQQHVAGLHAGGACRRVALHAANHHALFAAQAERGTDLAHNVDRLDAEVAQVIRPLAISCCITSLTIVVGIAKPMPIEPPVLV
ncbi:MAG: hypothetical protein U5L03_04055 [Burkholderiaceae bacterium]|nr:hypothetical protein [Burkholderiaceae bacterium]